MNLKRNLNSDEYENPIKARFVRVIPNKGEHLPPVIRAFGSSKEQYGVNYSDTLNIIVDISANLPPNVKVRYVHCDALWNEDDIPLIKSSGNLESSIIDWQPSPRFSVHFDYRGKVSIPNSQVKLFHSGNWKAKFFDANSESIFAEVRFFVVEPRASTYLNLFPEFYKPKYLVANSAINCEVRTKSNEGLVDMNIDLVAIFKNGRWFEPYFISNRKSAEDFNSYKHRYQLTKTIGGNICTEKIFRVDAMPSDNAYRVLDLSNLDFYPRSNTLFTTAFAEIPRQGSFFVKDNDGTMASQFIDEMYQDYLNIELLFNPIGNVSQDGVFLSGTFNNWNPDISWMLHYDDYTKKYYIKNWFPRGLHDYLICTGKYNVEKKELYQCSCDEYEGNNLQSGHTFHGFVYYNDIQNGGYDALISIGSASLGFID